MVTASWEQFKEVDPSKTYLAYGAYLERKTAWSYFNFLMRARKVAKQLSTTKGLVGFTARLGFLNKKVVQLAVFEDESSLKEFASKGQHDLCATEVKPAINWMKKTTWSISGSEIPPKIEDTIEKVQNL